MPIQLDVILIMILVSFEIHILKKKLLLKSLQVNNTIYEGQITTVLFRSKVEYQLNISFKTH